MRVQQYEQDAMNMDHTNLDEIKTLDDAIYGMEVILNEIKEYDSKVVQTTTQLGSIYLMKILMRVRYLSHFYERENVKDTIIKRILRALIREASLAVDKFKSLKGHESHSVVKNEIREFYIIIGGKIISNK